MTPIEKKMKKYDTNMTNGALKLYSIFDLIFLNKSDLLVWTSNLTIYSKSCIEKTIRYFTFYCHISKKNNLLFISIKTRDNYF